MILLQLVLRGLLLLSMALAVSSKRGKSRLAPRLTVLKENAASAKDVDSAAADNDDRTDLLGGSVVKPGDPQNLPVFNGCGGDFEGDSEGVIEYPGDGKLDPIDNRCTWNIITNPRTKISVNLDWFQTKNCDDQLLIKNGPNGAKIGQYCGTQSIPGFETKANKLFLYFYSNGTLNYKGFKLTWKVIGDSGSCQQPQPTSKPTISSTTTTTKTPTTTTKNPAKPPISTKTTTRRTTTKTATTPDFPASSLSCTCGIPNPAQRIIGGEAVVPNKYPWHVGLYSISEAYDYFCGGTIINTLYVLIAAHCLYPTYPSDLVIGVGDHNQTETLRSFASNAGLTDQISVMSVWVHSDYDPVTLDNDIGVAKLSRPLEFTDGFGIRPICLPNDAKNSYENEIGTILGWGATDYTDEWGASDFPHVLQQAEVRVLAPNCNNVHENLTSSMLCAASPGKDACVGDSGGSLTVSSSGQYTQIGIISWGYGCADEYYPGVYSRITAFLPWIKELTKDGEFCPAPNSPWTKPSTPPPKPTTPPLITPCTCGVPNYPKRIINGDPVDPHKYPWHVGMYRSSSNFKYVCGGTIINSLFVLTAGHCIYPNIPDDLMVGIGDHNRISYDDDVAITQYVSVAKAIRHKSYNHNKSDYDFALLKLSKHIQFNGEHGIRPICLPNDDQSTYMNEMAKILGWGRTVANGVDSLANILQEADVVIYNTNCNNKYKSWEFTEQMMCAASAGVDACLGDSGGSLAVFESGQYYQVGITSWGKSCADRKFPGVYSRVTAQLDWIKDNAKEGRYC